MGQSNSGTCLRPRMHSPRFNPSTLPINKVHMEKKLPKILILIPVLQKRCLVPQLETARLDRSGRFRRDRWIRSWRRTVCCWNFSWFAVVEVYQLVADDIFPTCRFPTHDDDHHLPACPLSLCSFINMSVFYDTVYSACSAEFSPFHANLLALGLYQIAPADNASSSSTSFEESPATKRLGRILLFDTTNKALCVV